MAKNKNKEKNSGLNKSDRPDELNKEQREAVVHGDGPLLIVAGAGTGKTKVITERIAYLIEAKKARPDEILALTFTEKAAEEMEERADKLLPYGYVDLWISTFHSFCERILKDHGLDIGLSNDFKLADQTAAWLLMKKNIDKFSLDYYRPLGNPNKFIHALISCFSRCKDQGISPEDFLKHSDGLKTNLTDLPEENEAERIKEVADAYHVYQKLLLDNNLLDFGDLINYCIRLFKERPLILKRYREKFKYILVDEFQDTNWSQYELIKMLAEPKNNLTVCADDDQAVYRWRGASYNNILQFKKDFPKAKEIFLIRNYRSTQDILDLSYKFIKANNPNRLEFVSKVDKKLISEKNKKGEIGYFHFRNSDEEVRGVIKKITRIMKENKDACFSDFAILVRANNQAIPFSQALERSGLPYQFLASWGLYSKPVVLDIISYLKLLDNYHESSAAYRVLNFPFLQIPGDDVVKITQYSGKKAKSIYEALQEIPLIGGISEKTAEKIAFILSLIKKHAEMARSKRVSEVFISFLADSGYLKYLTSGNSKQELNLALQFYKKIKGFEESVQDPILKNFMAQLDMELESGEEGKLDFDPEQGPDMIRIMTIHSAKGLEFRYVFLVNLVDKRFPSIERKDPIEIPAELIKEVIPQGDTHLEEERRIFYVAATRAKEGLFLTSSEDYGGKRKKKVSRFITELGMKPSCNAPANICEVVTGAGRPACNASQAKRSDAGRENIVLPNHFSFSQLAAFENCPLRYKFAHILRVPVRSKAVFSFGKTMHNALCEFLKLAEEKKSLCQKKLFEPSKNKKSPAKENLLTLKDLMEIYDKEWIDEWYENKKQKEEYYALGKKSLKNFSEKYVKNPPEILKINGLIGLELPFILKIGGDSLKGKIDRIDASASLNEGVNIIDYKTGEGKENLSSDDKLQLAIYKIALKEIFNIEADKLTYLYLNEGKELSFSMNEKDVEKQKKIISEKIENIKKSDFAPTPGWQCQFCDFKNICDSAKKS